MLNSSGQAVARARIQRFAIEQRRCRFTTTSKNKHPPPKRNGSNIKADEDESDTEEKLRGKNNQPKQNKYKKMGLQANTGGIHCMSEDEDVADYSPEDDDIKNLMLWSMSLVSGASEALIM